MKDNVIRLQGAVKDPDWSADYEKVFRDRMYKQIRHYMEEQRRKEEVRNRAKEREEAVRRTVSKWLWVSIGALSAAVGCFAASGDLVSMAVAAALTVICIVTEVINNA